MQIEDWVTTRLSIREAGLRRGVADNLIDAFGEDCEVVRKAFVTIKDPDIDEGERAVISAISTEAVDRDHEVMLLKGVDLKWYKRNPVVMYGHNYSALPVGKNAWIRKDKGRLMAKTVFASAEANPIAENIYQLFKEKILRSWSVGFIVLESREPKEDEFDGQDVRRVITKWVLLEYSAVPIPSNMEALTTAVGKGLELEDAVSKDLGLTDCPTCEMQDVDYDALPEEGAKPLPNEHACRLLAPGDFSKFRRGTRTSGGKKYSIIFGQPKGGGGWKEQAYRYGKGTWSASEARTHCKKHDGSFEAAKEAEQDAATAGKDVFMFNTDELQEMMDTRLAPILERMDAIENPKPATVRIMEPEQVEPKAAKPLKIEVPDDFGKNLGQLVAKGVRAGIGQSVEDRLDVRAGRVKELE